MLYLKLYCTTIFAAIYKCFMENHIVLIKHFLFTFEKNRNTSETTCIHKNTQT